MSLFPLSKYIPRSRIADKFIVNFVKKKKKNCPNYFPKWVYIPLYILSVYPSVAF